MLIPERHTRNIFYLQNIARLSSILRQAGLNVRLGTLSDEIKKPKELIPNIFVYWDEAKSQLTIGNYEILSAQKCSLAHSIAHIEQMIRDLTGKDFVIIDDKEVSLIGSIGAKSIIL